LSFHLIIGTNWGDTSFRPIDWQVKFTPEVNINYLHAQENGVVNFDVRKGNTRVDAHWGCRKHLSKPRSRT
jgi:hypothetical protein